MGDLLSPRLGSQPWNPAPDADLEETWNYYDVPLTGIVVQQGVRHLFHVVLGGGRDVSVWLYCPLSTDEEKILKARPPGEIRDVIEERIIAGARVTVAVADDDGIIWADQVDDTHEGLADLLSTVRQRLDDVVADLRHASERLEPV